MRKISLWTLIYNCCPRDHFLMEDNSGSGFLPFYRGNFHLISPKSDPLSPRLHLPLTRFGEIKFPVPQLIVRIDTTF